VQTQELHAPANICTNYCIQNQLTFSAIRAKCRAVVAPQYSSKPELNRVVRRCTNIHMKRFEDLSPSAQMAH
jgi:hypothetical protein